MDKPFPDLELTRMQTFGEGSCTGVQVHVDLASSGVFSVEQTIVKANLT